MKNLLRLPILIIIISLLVYGCQSKTKPSQNMCNSLFEIMNHQQLAWNNGDIDAFMLGYWKSDSLQFIGKSGITMGWQATLDNYKKSYPNQSAMGKLTFNNLDCEVLGVDVHYIIGQWTLHRTTDTLQGHYTLLWKKISGEWVIVRDHSS